MKRVIVLILVLLIIGSGIFFWLRGRAKKSSNPGEVQLAQVERGTVALTVSSDGVMQPLTTVSVKSYAGGRIDHLAVDVGDVVKAGDLIAKIDPTDSLAAYDQARADLAAAQARLSQAKTQAKIQPILTQASIAQAQASYDSSLKDLEGLEEAGQPQARASAASALERSKANLDIAEKELERAEGLKEQGFISQSELDAAINRRDLAKSELNSVQERWDTLEQELATELASAKARVAQSKASLDRALADAVQDELKQADVLSAQAQVARAEASEINARTMLEYTTITAPRDGVILQKFVEEGTIVTSGRSSVAQGTDIVLLGDLTKMFVEVSLDEADAGMVQAGQPVEIMVDAFPDEIFHGILRRIDPQAVTQQNVTTVLVLVEIEEPSPKFKPGITASCDFVIDRVEDTLFLPSRTVRQRRGESLVEILQGKERVHLPVKVGLVGDERTEILEGLAEGDEVIFPGFGENSFSRSDWARERGRRAGGAGGFIRNGR